MSAYNYRTHNNAVVFLMPQSQYRGKRVRIVRSRVPGVVGCVGRVTIHNTDKNILCVVLDDWREIWTHVDNVVLEEEKQ